jgi:hypothetical protein
MRSKVELHRDVVWFIRHQCNADEADAFYRELDRLRSDPIECSEALADPKLSRYMLRFFRFGQNLAIFEYNAAKDRARVLECRRIPPEQLGKPKGDDSP